MVAVLVYRGQRSANMQVNTLPAHAALSVTFGDTSAKNKVVVYTDPMCEKCGEYHTDTLQRVYDDYVKPGKISLEIRPLGIVSEYSAPLTDFLMCSNEQGKYWDATKYVYSAIGRKNGRERNVNAAAFYIDFPVEKIAKTIGLDESKLASCITKNSYATKLSQADTQAYAANIYSTPTTFVGDKDPVRGYAIYPYIKNLIDINL